MAKKAITIQGKTSILGIIKDIQDTIDGTIQKAVDRFCYVGERCVVEARKAGEYNDITGNLRSSIGYVVLFNGQPYQYSKSRVFRGREYKNKTYKGKKLVRKKGNKGTEEGRAFLERLAEEFANRYPQGIVLIVAAGMEYAIYVEAIHNLNVLTSAELLADELVPIILQKLGFTKTV